MALSQEQFSSQLLQNAVEEFSSLPGVGRRSALRFALHLLKLPQENVERLGRAIVDFRSKVRYCSRCNMISDTDTCPICSSPRRNRELICVVESIRDVMSIENTAIYNGLYHVLGVIISPMDGIGSSDLPIESLLERVKSEGVKEVILALSTSMEGETTAFYLYRKLEPLGVKITGIARGVGFGDDLEYTDQLTLGRSIENRQPFKPN